MRSYPDRVKIYWQPTFEVVYESAACRFGFLDTAKSDVLFGSGVPMGGIYMPLTTPLPPVGSLNNIRFYRFQLVSPVTEPIKRNVGIMQVNQVKIGRNHQYFIVEIDQPSTADVE